MTYEVRFLSPANTHLEKLYRSGDKLAIKRFERILEDLTNHPETGIGSPNRKKYGYSGCWARAITEKHRLIYIIDKEKALVSVLSAYGHYGDK